MIPRKFLVIRRRRFGTSNRAAAQSIAALMRMSRRYGHIGQAAQREAVRALNGADFVGGVHQNGNQIPDKETAVALTQ